LSTSSSATVLIVPQLGCLRFADLESCDFAGGGAAGFGEELVGVEDTECGVGGFDGEGFPCVVCPDAELLSCDDEGASGADAAVDAQPFGGWLWWWSGGAGVAEPGGVGGAERVGQAAEQHSGTGDLHEAAVEADGDALAGVVGADGVLASGESDEAVAVDQAVGLDGCAGGDQRRPLLTGVTAGQAVVRRSDLLSSGRAIGSS
jgi:hypothetical protein